MTTLNDDSALILSHRVVRRCQRVARWITYIGVLTTCVLISPLHVQSRSSVQGDGIGSTNHTGIDLGVGVGTVVRAAGDGVVNFVALRGGYGLLVIITHDVTVEGGLVGGSSLVSGRRISTYYAHLNSAQVRPGARVVRGQQIALSGGAAGSPTAGTATGPHLHFETRIEGAPTNPIGLLPS